MHREPRVHRRERTPGRSFAARIEPRLVDYLVPTFSLAAVPLAYGLLAGSGPSSAVGAWIARLAAFVAFAGGSAWYLFAIRGKPARVTVDAESVSAGDVTLARAELTCELQRWVDRAYGTTAGSALVLRQGARVLTLGCKGPAPEGEPTALSSTTEVALVLAARDFQALVSELVLDGPQLPARSGAALFTANLVPNPWSARGILHGLRPFPAIVLVTGLVSFFITRVVRLPEAALAPVSLLLGVAGMVFLLRSTRRPVRTRYHLRVEGRTITLLDARSSKLLATCALADLGVEHRLHVRHSRFGTSKQLCLLLRFPHGPKLELALAEGRLNADRGQKRLWLAPSSCIGAGEWDTLLRLLHR